ncbi:MAG: glycosyltransferase [Hydrogenophaga sp.]|uniref:glycosyltransferase family 4 protein n=1 Tax=Hydrogenophaga sp. TaxID=1904254 RepID=UPI00169A2FD9|nr:glycosyltransferase family 1 protein [Hydrogenophaga sp.]NIM41848.1 glycosyltransferase [Hydrogenophaga sp.]NIN27153.1 glycosyltransferase [Hydrogenophaga sp.]NIN31854.1 glycosyltransferase [Hydrogenophaga sp.]NIN56098.1 glycosyltransferase [Hydrogenophaga sp.]NIO52225.1 glycosyltransferase [Hydrogenophaga sp.]
MSSSNAEPILVEEFPAARPSLRLSVVTETWPPEINGVALTLSRLVQGLCARNHQVQLIRPRQAREEAARQDPGFQELLMRGMPIPRYPDLKLGLPSKGSLVRAWTLHRPDLVHIATEGPLGWSALQAARRLRLPVTSDFRTNFHAYSRHYGVGWLKTPIVAYLRKFHNLTRCTMVPTQGLRAELQAIGFQNVQVVARGVDTQLFSPERRDEALRQSWGAGPDALVMVAVGRLAAEKNLEVVIQAYEAMRSAREDVRLVFVGDGPMRAALQQRCPAAHFAGMRRGEDLAAHYASADLFVFPSLTETFGNVTIEALASGLPVLAFDTAAAGDWVRPGHNGWLLPVDDARGLAQQALALARDPAQVRAAAAHARAQVAQLDWQQIARQVEEIFLRTAGWSSPAPAASPQTSLAV